MAQAAQSRAGCSGQHGAWRAVLIVWPWPIGAFANPVAGDNRRPKTARLKTNRRIAARSHAAPEAVNVSQPEARHGTAPVPSRIWMRPDIARLRVTT